MTNTLVSYHFTHKKMPYSSSPSSQFASHLLAFKSFCQQHFTQRWRHTSYSELGKYQKEYWHTNVKGWSSLNNKAMESCWPVKRPLSTSVYYMWLTLFVIQILWYHAVLKCISVWVYSYLTLSIIWLDCWISQSVSYMINWCRQRSLSQHRLWEKVKRHKSFGKMKLRQMTIGQSKSKANISWAKWNRRSGPEPILLFHCHQRNSGKWNARRPVQPIHIATQELRACPWLLWFQKQCKEKNQ